MKQVNKVISIGANCLSLDFSKFLGIREKSPVDNFSGFNIWKAPALFTKEFKKDLFRSSYKTRKATDFELKRYYFNKIVFDFEKGFSIVHNDFESRRFRHSLKKRIRIFHKYYKKSLTDDSLWYVYSLDKMDAGLNENSLFRIKNELPKNVVSHLIILAIRTKNPLFKKYFNYYVELDGEEKYRWGDKSQGIEIADILEKQYQIKINYEKE